MAVAFVIYPTQVLGQLEDSGMCRGNPGCESIRNRDQCIVTCAPDIGSNVGMNVFNPTTWSCIPGSSKCRWKWVNATCQAWTTCLSDADCWEGGTCGGGGIEHNIIVLFMI